MAGFGILQKGEGRVIISGQMECEGKQLTFVSKVVANPITYLPYTQKQTKNVITQMGWHVTNQLKIS